MSTNALLLLGRDHEVYGRHTVVDVSPQTACAISAGSDAEFARTTQKEHVNEDGVLVLEDRRHTVLCVADAHFGREASEELLERLADALRPVPENPDRLDAVFARLAGGRPRSRHGSETTLLVCILDRMFRQAFGMSFGDSSLVRVTADGVVAPVSEKTNGFVSLTEPLSLSPVHARRFAFSPAAGDLLLAYTDGVDECSYRDPDHSITPEILGELLAQAGDSVHEVVDAITRLALAGVDGNPGGQDNVAIAATRV